ncbi:adhesion G protein-coupled receptor B2 isoform X1 [Lates japonicus]|uniref:Adhesion G protein-coupled receptor B2 isoform X1 n=1 Tax=Lates japonicus TaxID=270547 RepID=A0AAD3R700_LATJO|nr:adhesion G protein-coupled receptor B2 isoform X1 [Lates japonicus]
MSQFECSQTVSRTMGIQVNKGKVNPLTRNHLSSPIISQTDSLPHYSPTSRHNFHSMVQMRGALSGREWASSTNTVADIPEDFRTSQPQRTRAPGTVKTMISPSSHRAWEQKGPMELHTRTGTSSANTPDSSEGDFQTGR